MGGASYPAGVTSVYGETLEVSTTLASLGMPGIETKQAIVYNPNYDFRLHINPAVTGVVVYTDANDTGAKFVSAGNTSTLSRDLTDRSATGSGTALDALTTSDILYICLSDKVAGLHIDMTSSVNTNASTMTVKYSTASVTGTPAVYTPAWTDITVTDNTKEGGSTSLQADGDLTWTVPSDWLAVHLGGPNVDNMAVVTTSEEKVTVTPLDKSAPGIHGFWLQIYWSAALSSDVEIANIWTLNKNTTRGYFHGGQEYPISFDRRYTGGIEVILEEDKIPDGSSTDDMEITWIRTVI